MGGDYGPPVLIPAALQVLAEHADLHIVFVGRESDLTPLLSQHGAALSARWTIQHASQVVESDEPPASALRGKKDSSMRVAINLVKSGQAQACVSAGNTGALMAMARFVLKTLPGIDRPAIITGFPTQEGGEVRMLDVGANVDCDAEQLFQFAVMGSALTQLADNSDRPKIGLLNIGEESIKGTEQIKQAAALLSKCTALNYIGYVEGDDIFTGIADVIVCDGFVGNVTIKACEGVAKLIAQSAKKVFKANLWSQLAALPALPLLKRFSRFIDPKRHNGATLLGLDGIVIKSHGGADIVASRYAIEEALVEIEKNVPEQIRQLVQHTMTQIATE